MADSPLARLVVKLEAESSRLTSELEKSRKATERYAKESKKSTDLVAASFSRMQTVGVAALGAIASAQITKTLAEFDRLNASLKTVTGSLEAAGAASQALKQFSTETPFELAEVTSAFIKMRALGFDASIESMRKLGNAASAMGTTLADAVDAVAAAARGEFDPIEKFGIQINKEGEKLKVTFHGVTKEINNDARSIQAEFARLSDANFATGMSDQMDTVGGKLSNLEDAFSNFVDFVGNLGVRDALKSSFEGAIEFLETTQKLINSIFGSGIEAQKNYYEIQLAAARKIHGVALGIKKVPILGDALLSNDTLADSERDIRNMEESLQTLSKAQAALERPPVNFAGTPSAGSGGSGGKSGKTAASEARKAAQDQIQVLEAQFAEFKASLDREQKMMDAAMALELERAGENAEKKLEIEQRYQKNATVLKQEEIKGEIELKKKVDALNDDRGESAKLLAEINGLEKDLIATQRLAGIEAETLAEKTKKAAIARKDELKSVFDVWEERGGKFADVIDPPQVEQKMDEISQFAVEGARNIQDAFADFLFDPFKGGLSGMAESFGETIRRMLANAAAANIMGAMFGTEFGKTGQLGEDSWLNKGIGLATKLIGAVGSFAGASDLSALSPTDASLGGGVAGEVFPGAGLNGFAEGGRPTLGRLAVVGERGPELFVPDTAGTIIPHEAIGAFARDRAPAMHMPAAADNIKPVSVQNNSNTQVVVQVRGEDTPRSRQSAQQLAADIGRQVERARIRNG